MFVFSQESWTTNKQIWRRRKVSKEDVKSNVNWYAKSVIVPLIITATMAQLPVIPVVHFFAGWRYLQKLQTLTWSCGQLANYKGHQYHSLFLGGAHFLSARRLLRITILKDWDSLKVWESFRVRESLKSFKDFLKVSKIS